MAADALEDLTGVKVKKPDADTKGYKVDPDATNPAANALRDIQGIQQPTTFSQRFSTAEENPLDQKTQPKPTGGDIAADVAKSGGIGLVKGGIGVLGSLGDASDLLARSSKTVGDYVGGKLGYEKSPELSSVRLPGTADIQKTVEGYTGDFYKPRTTAGEYAQTTGEFAAGAALGPMNGGRAVAARVLRYGVAPAVASETAGQMTKGTAAEPWARAGTALATGGMAAAFDRPASAAAAIRDQLPSYINDTHITAAEDLMHHAQDIGVPLSWDEALSRVTGRPVLQDMRRVVESAPQSRTRMQEFTQDRPQQIQDAAGQAFHDIAPQSRAPNAIGPAVGQAAENTIGDVRGAINANDAPSYAAAATVQLDPATMARVRGLPGYQEAADAVRGDAQLNRDVAHLPENSVGFLNEVKKQLDQMATNSRAPLSQNPNMQRAIGTERDATDLRDTLTRTSQDYAQALNSQATNRERYLAPLLNGPLGKIADRDLTTKNAINAIFDKNPLPGSEEEIGTAVGAVAHRNPQAARDLVRAHAEMAFNRASESLAAEGTQFTGAKFSKDIAGNPQERANLREAVRALPNGDARWTGFNRFLDVMEATGERQALGSKTTFNQQELERLSRPGGVLGTVQTLASPQTYLTLFKGRLEQWKLGRNLDQLADILTNPRSGDLLRQISRMPPDSQAAGHVAARLLTQTAAGARGGRLYVSPASQQSDQVAQQAGH